MNNIERRDRELAYCSDDAVMEEQKVCRRILQKLNFMDRSDFDGIGGNTVICPGVHVGDNVVIGAGSVVTKDIPDWCVAAGNPCRVLRKITEDDRKKLFHDEEIDPEAWEDIVRRGFGG